jgi:hypothetical protein
MPTGINGYPTPTPAPTATPSSTLMRGFQTSGVGVAEFYPSGAPSGCLTTAQVIGYSQQANANWLNVQIWSWWYDDGVHVAPLQNLISECHSANIKVLLCLVSDTTTQTNTIMNVGGAQSTWINMLDNTVNVFKPDGLNIMDEPPSLANAESVDSSVTSENQLATAYQNFCNTAIQSVRSQVGMSNIPIIVGSCGFTETNNAVAYPIEQPNVYYQCHLTYCEEGYLPPTSDPSYTWCNAYYNNGQPLTTSEHQTALADLMSYLESSTNNQDGALYMRSQGETPIFDECGAYGGCKSNLNPSWPNENIFMQDLFSIANQYNIGVFVDWCQSSETSSEGGITTGGSLNSYGQCIVNNLVN